MSDDGEKPADANAPAPRKGKMGLVIGIVIAVVTLVGGSVAGAMFGPRLLGSSEESESSGKHGKSAKGERAHKDEKSDEHETGEENEPPGKIVTYDVPAVVVDLRDGDGRIRHLKVGLTAELGEHARLDELKLVIPRGREATITYLRSLSFEEVSDPERFVVIKDELGKRVIEALGKERIRRMVLTDFVVQ